jgi:DNA-binding transcriptional MocR family regulator
LNITVNRHSSVTIKEQVRLEIAQRIQSGLLEEGHLLPSVRQLSSQLHISLVTAHQVYQGLEKDGLIDAIRGKGTFVKKCKVTPIQNTQPPHPALPPFQWQLSVPDYLPRASYWSHSAVRLPPEILDLSTASIHHSLLPLDLLQDSIKHALSKHTRSLGSYSPYQGDREFLEAISHYLFTQSGLTLEPHRLIITNGTQQGLDLFARTFLGPGDVIAMETPCFSSAIDTFRLSRATIQPIPLDHDGMRIDVLEELASRGRIKAIYTVPTFQNPTGIIMSYRRRKEILEFAEANNILILEDDPHRELFSAGNGLKKLPPPLKSLDTTGRVIYLKGFSKFLFPGLRLGIMAADGSIYNRLLAIKSIADLGSPLWLQKALLLLFTSPHLTRYIKSLNQTLAQRRELVAAMLSRELNPVIYYPQLAGGMHLWLTLPPDLAADDLIPAAHQCGIHFLPGSIFYPAEPELNHLRICWTNLSNEDLPKALSLLCDLLNRALTAKP